MKFSFYISLLFIKNTKLALEFLKTKRELLKAISVVDSVFVFPHYHTGGAEKVHLKVAQVAIGSGLNPVFIFTGKSVSTTYKKQFQNLGKCIDIGFRYDNVRLNRDLLTSIVNKINHSKLKLLFGSNSSFYYQILDEINLHNLSVMDLVHAYNPPFEISNISFKHVFHKMNTRIFINEPSLVKMKEFYDSELSGLNSNHFQLIYNSPFNENTEPDIPSEKKMNQVFKILFISRNSPEKRPSIAFKIAQTLTKRIPGKYHFFMIGDFASYKSDFNSKDITIISNLKDADEIIELYKTAHCLILTSETEGFPLVISEAMFYNTVPVSTNVGGIPFVLEHNKNAILIDSLLDTKTLVETFCNEIIGLSANEVHYKQLSMSAFDTAKKYFSNDEFSKKYKTLFLAR